ncbi:lipid phosphate phosphatase epsilon 1, chloroplastic-like [Selaginella moellendorffii]|uniref:lipid phosphate phosphatase epsilon 1, chloroplastic-like n=1 Tax=Selaginella moellendorffii TaxID=88036 RepID=UPI000D1C9FE6|nr:lipid phosphate phosphatase epsilon 1, chloroplastic-like [Selaginella moellendorffii]|eukprot:XP_024532790.1 lipid phosphate phosphatase epsilon 1, chloroplastic-like [Selaginella moellendorffii]
MGALESCTWKSSFIQLANRTSKWAITGLATGFLLYRQNDPASMWAITGALANGATSKLLKQCINQQRPIAAANHARLDPGMPSSHAQSLAYLSTYATIEIAGWSGVNPVLSLALRAIVLSTAAYLAHLRISMGFHTSAQVAVGSVIGSSSAVIWNWIWKAIVEQHAVNLPWMSKAGWMALFVAGSLALARESK